VTPENQTAEQQAPGAAADSQPETPQAAVPQPAPEQAAPPAAPPPEPGTLAAPNEFMAGVATDQLPRALFGYDRSTIVELLDTMSGRIRTLVQERTEHLNRIAELDAELRRNQENSRLIAETLVAAREEAKAIKERATDEATKAVQAAQKQAERIFDEAANEGEAKAKELVESAEEMRQTIIDMANKDRQALLAEAGRARAFVEETHEQLSDFLMAAVRWYEQVKPTTEIQPSPALAELSRPDVPVAPAADGDGNGQAPKDDASSPANDLSSNPPA